MKKNSTCC